MCEVCMECRQNSYIDTNYSNNLLCSMTLREKTDELYNSHDKSYFKYLPGV